MRDLIQQEQFEMELLDRLNSHRLLHPLVFIGGTMLRLCHGLNRFSVDLDFWMAKAVSAGAYFKKCRKALEQEYMLKDAANKFHTLLFEVRSKNYPRSLKLEIRKEIKTVKTEECIAYSRHAEKQVLLKTLPLDSMMEHKLAAFLERSEIRDCFDMEFLLKKGIELKAPTVTLKKCLDKIEALHKKDYTVKLSSILEPPDRKYYRENNFKILKARIMELLQEQ